jgi:hypothetical protein
MRSKFSYELGNLSLIFEKLASMMDKNTFSNLIKNSFLEKLIDDSSEEICSKTSSEEISSENESKILTDGNNIVTQNGLLAKRNWNKAYIKETRAKSHQKLVKIK